jgi:Zn-dependent M28 family amino/carboxypeptidase
MKKLPIVLAAASLSAMTWAASLAAPAASAGPAAALRLSPGAAAAMASIDAERIRAHVRFLADDLLEGRGPGVRGGDIAAKYIAAQFEQLGLKPAGDNGTYLQQVNFKGVLTQPQSTASISGAGAPMDLALAQDYVITNETQTETTDIDAPIVFVGFGIDAPEYQWNDYQGVDVKGKVVLVIVNEPPSNDPKFFTGEALTYYGRWIYKYEQAARQGAVGAIIIHRTDLASYDWSVVRNSWTNEQVYLRDDQDPKLKAAAWVQQDIARKMMSASGLDLDQMIKAAGTRGFKARELPLRFKAHTVSTVREFQSPNVLGILPGTQAGAPRQAVVYSAHYDHLGIDPRIQGDQIYNGAVDNATGCGVLLELAHAYAKSSVRPPQPVLFAAVTAEEKGLLGSNYLGKHLPIPAAAIALDLNYDAIQPEGIPESVSLTGAERTTFYPVVNKTAQAFHFDIQGDPEPGAGHYYRSDHFSLARTGVPAFSVNLGSKFKGQPLAWGKALQERYTEKNYHRPSDEYTPQMDFTTNALLARFGFALGWQALTANGTVSWLPGDEFESARKRSLQAQ